MIDLPSGRQTFDFDCGAKALQLVMAYYGVDVREDELLKALHCDTEGVSVNSMISVAKDNGFAVSGRSGTTIEEVKQLVDENRPVIVLVQAWAERYMTLEDWWKDVDDGHYVIVIGHVGSIIVFEDPSSFRKTWLTEGEFNARWHDIDPETKEVLDHFAMVLLGKSPDPSPLEHMN
jgi:predicted double-glycine peptidase